MEHLAQSYARRPVEFLIVYTREPHPNQGEFAGIGQPASYEGRRRLALRTREELAIKRPVLVDGMDGTVQRAYGGLPNMIYLIGRDGRVVYRAAWADPGELERVLKREL